MISGYYSYCEDKNVVKKKLPNKIIHVLKLLIVAEVIYGIYYLMKNKEFSEYDNVILKIFTGSFFNGTLWFLYALFWSYICLYIINKLNIYRFAYIIAPIVLIIHVVLKTLVKTQTWYDVAYFRNFLFYGLPFLLIGSFIRYKESKIIKHITNKMCIVGVIVGEIIVCIEYIITQTTLDFYIGTIIVAICLFIFAIKNPQKVFSLILEFVGERLSMYVYIVHIFAINFSMYICAFLHNMDYFTPIIAVSISLIISFMIHWIFERLKHNLEEVIL